MGSFSDLEEQQSDHSDNVEVFCAYIVAKALLKGKQHLRESEVGIEVAQTKFQQLQPGECILEAPQYSIAGHTYIRPTVGVPLSTRL